MSTQTQGKQTQWLKTMTMICIAVKIVMNRLLVVKKHVYSKGLITSKLLFSMKSVDGSYHHDNALIFGINAWYQCRPIALAALIFSLLFAVSEWGT